MIEKEYRSKEREGAESSDIQMNVFYILFFNKMISDRFFSWY